MGWVRSPNGENGAILPVLFDPQTSGGLVLSIPQSQADEMMKSLHAAGVASATQVGEVVDGPVSLEVV